MRSPVPSLALEVDFIRRNVRVDGLPIDLTAPEFGILAALAREPGTVVTRRALLDTAFGPGFADEDLVDLHIATLREKLGDGGSSQGLIETVGATGYRLASND